MLKSCKFPLLKRSLGQHVYIEGNKSGILQYVGEIPFADGIWCGVELEEAVGDNDGRINDIRYFTCNDHHGLFVPASEIHLLDETVSIEKNQSYLLDHTSVLNESDDLKLQKTNQHNLYNMDKLQLSSQNSQEKALKVFNVISNDWSNSEFSTVSAEVGNLISDVNYSSNDSRSIFLGSIKVKSFSTEAVDKVDKISEYDFKTKDLTDSEESLGILPDLLEDLTSWDTLLIDTAKPNDLNTTVNLSGNSLKNLIMGSQNTVSEKNADNAVLNSTCILQNTSFAYNEEAESPVQSGGTLPKFASTPKHEINFSDENDTLNLTLNFSSEFHMDKSDPEKRKQEEFQNKNITMGTVATEGNNLNINFNDTYIPEREKNGQNHLLNVTLTFSSEAAIEYGDLYEKQTDSPRIILENEGKDEEILNGTFVIEDKSPGKRNETFIDSGNTIQDSKENIIPDHLSVSKTDKNQVFEASPFCKREENTHKFERKNFRRSVACFHRNSISENKVDDKPVRRKSLSGSTRSLPKSKPFEPKVSKLSKISYPSLRHSVKLSSDGNTGNSQKKFIDMNDFAGKSIPIGTKISVKNAEEVKLVSKARNSQECFLNETIDIPQSVLDVRKTVVKKPQHAVNFPCLKPVRQVGFDVCSIPSKLGGKELTFPCESQNVSGASALPRRSLIKKPVASVGVNEKDKKISRVPTARLAEKNICIPSTSKKSISSLETHSIIPVPKQRNVGKKIPVPLSKQMPLEAKECQTQGSTKSRLNDTVLIMEKQSIVARREPEGCYPSISEEYIDEEYKKESKVNLNETVLLSDKRKQGQALKYPTKLRKSVAGRSNLPLPKLKNPLIYKSQ